MNFIIWTTLSYDHAPVRPVGAYQIASWLRQHGYTVKVIDFCHHLASADIIKMTKHYIDETTIAVGVSSTFWTPSEVSNTLDKKTNNTEPRWVLECRDAIESEYPHLDWILGGGGSILPFFKKDWIKIHGDGEDQILKYFDEKTNNKQPRSLFDIKTMVKHYHETDFIEPHETLSIELGRGCQFKCKFCRFHNIGKKPGTYLRSIDCIEQELLYNYEQFGTTKYYFLDDTVNEDPTKIAQIAELAKRLPFRLQWTGYIRMDLVWTHTDSIDQLMESGMRSAFIGVESFNPETSRIVGKGWNGKFGKQFLNFLKKQWGDENPMFLSFIVGLPKESRESLWETANWLKDNGHTAWSFYPLNIYRTENLVWKSEFDRSHEQYGYRFPKPLDDKYWVNEYWNTNSAIQFSNELNRFKKPFETRAGWGLFDYTNTGDPLEKYTKLKAVDYNQAEVQSNKRQFLDRYITKTMNYGK